MLVFAMKVIPIKAQAGVSGFESPAAEYTALELSLDQLLVKHPNATFLGVASGESMQGVGIFDGDLLIVDRAIKVSSYDVIVANYNNEFVCKILDIENRLLLSAGVNKPAVTIREADIFQLEGVVISSVRLLKSVPALNKCTR